MESTRSIGFGHSLIDNGAGHELPQSLLCLRRKVACIAMSIHTYSYVHHPQVFNIYCSG